MATSAIAMFPAWEVLTTLPFDSPTPQAFASDIPLMSGAAIVIAYTAESIRVPKTLEDTAATIARYYVGIGFRTLRTDEQSIKT